MEIVEANNPYQAAVVARDRHGDGVDIADVRPAVGRAPSTTRTTTAKRTKAWLSLVPAFEEGASKGAVE